MSSSGDPPTGPIAPPRRIGGILRRLGPGIIITGSIVGSGELIVTTKLGADVGFTLLWLIILSCAIKVFVQVEIGRHVISSGRSTLESFALLPGPALCVSARHREGRPSGRAMASNWVVWCWAVMAFFTLFQLAGILGGVAEVFTLTFTRTELWWWALALTAVTTALLASGRYGLVEKPTTFLVFVFTTLTIVAGFRLQATEAYAVHAADLAAGLSFRIPEGGLLTAFAMFGVTGVGASELIYYPYWCLEKGYARFAGPPDGTDAWVERARGWVRVMHVDAWVSLVIYTTGTVAFYLLGAAVLNRKGLLVENREMLSTLSHMYTETFGAAAGMWVFLAGAFAVLYSTFFVATASNTRLFADAGQVFGLLRYGGDEERRAVVRKMSIALPAFCFLVLAAFGFHQPVKLVLFGAVAQACMLPIIAVATVYLRYRRTDPRIATRSIAVDGLLWLSVATMIAVGLYQLLSRLDFLG